MPVTNHIAEGLCQLFCSVDLIVPKRCGSVSHGLADRCVHDVGQRWSLKASRTSRLLVRLYLAWPIHPPSGDAPSLSRPLMHSSAEDALKFTSLELYISPMLLPSSSLPTFGVGLDVQEDA